jgi:hypothetical protein
VLAANVAGRGALADAGAVRTVSLMVTRYGLCAALVLAACANTPPAVGDRAYRDHVLTSRASPEIALQIDPAFRRLPTLTFPLESMTDVERHTFVDVRDGGLQRMIVVQFERAQADSDFRFRYGARPPRQFGAETYRFGTYVYDDAAAARVAPDREAARTRALLIAQGYAPPRLWRLSRLARVTDAEGFTEIIIFYMENADGDYPPGPLPGADEDGDLVLEGEPSDALVRRMESAIRPLRG